MLQPAGPWAAQAALGEHHLPHMPVDLRPAWGEDLAAVARWAGVSEDTTKRRLRDALSEIFDTLSEPVRRDGYAAGTWVNAHLTCCLADEVV